MKMRDLLDKQGRFVEELRGIMSAPSGTDGDLTETQETRAGELKTELAKVQKQIDFQCTLDEAERRTSGSPIVGDAHFEKELRSFSLAKMLQRQLGVTVDVGRELEISQELARREGRSSEGFFAPYSVFEVEKRDTMTSATNGSLIAQEHHAGQYIDLLRQANPLTAFGVRHLSGLQGNVEIPRLQESTSVGWTAENTMLPDTGAKFDKLTLAPKHVGAVCEYSRNMILQSSPDIEQILRGDLAQVMGLEMARATLLGAGGVEPTGVLNTAGIQKVAKPAKPMEYIPALAAALFVENVTNPAYLGSAGMKTTIEKLLTTDGLPIGSNAFFRGASHTFSKLLPEENLLLAGDFSQIIQGTWGTIEVLLNPYAESAYRKGNVMLRIIATADVGLRHPQAFATMGA